MKKLKITERDLRRLIKEEVGKLTRFGRDPEDYSEDDYLHVDDMQEDVNEVIEKVKEMYTAAEELKGILDRLEKKSDSKTEEMGLKDIGNDLYNGIRRTKQYTEKAIIDLKEILTSGFHNYMEDKAAKLNPYFHYFDKRMGSY